MGKGTQRHSQNYTFKLGLHVLTAIALNIEPLQMSSVEGIWGPLRYPQHSVIYYTQLHTKLNQRTH